MTEDRRVKKKHLLVGGEEDAVRIQSRRLGSRTSSRRWDCVVCVDFCCLVLLNKKDEEKKKSSLAQTALWQVAVFSLAASNGEGGKNALFACQNE